MVRSLVAVLVLVALPLDAQRIRVVRSYPLDTPANWLRHRAIALDDFARLVRLTASARVVAFGEVTHGTHETCDARLRIIPKLIDDGGFRILAIEGPYAQYAALDDFLLTGAGDPGELLRNDPYFFWDTEEMLALILWARARNAAGIAPPIRIAGVDATEPIAAGKRVVAALKNVDPDLAAFAELEYGCLPGCDAKILEVRARIESRRVLFGSAEEFEETVHAARVVEQGVEVGADFFGKRDPMMAENALRLAARGKVILIGHNEHWSRIEYELNARTFRSTGQHLVAALGDAYFVIGSIVLDGTYYAVDAQQRRVVAFEIDPPVAGDWALVLAEAHLPTVVIPLFAPVPEWLTAARPMRFAGSAAPMQVTPPQSLAAKFDAVLSIRTSTPSRLRHFPFF